MKKKKQDDFHFLIDPGEMEHAISIISEVADVTPIERPHPLAKTIEQLIVKPLKQYLEREYRKTDGRGHTGTEAAVKFQLAAEEIVQGLQVKGNRLSVGHVSILEKRWRQLIYEIGSATYVKQMIAKSKGGRRPTDKRGYYLAIKKVLEIKGNDISRENIWRYFKRFNEQDPLFVDEYEIFFDPDITGHADDDYLVQNNLGRIRKIKKKTFFGYITEIRQKQKK